MVSHKYSVLLIVLLLLPFHGLWAQVIQGGLLGGFNLSQVDGDEVYGFHKFGWNAGATAIIPFGEKWSVSLETSYNQKGSYQGTQFNDSLSGEYRLQLNYLDVPVLVHFTDKDIITIGSGFSWGRLVEVREWEHGKRVEGTTIMGPYSRNDVNVLADIRFRLKQRFHFNLRYAYSVAKIRSREFPKINTTRDQFNNTITFRVLYIFNEKIPEARKKNKQ